MVTSTPGPQRGHHLSSAACHVPCEKPSCGPWRAVGSPRGCSFLSCWGVLCSWGRSRVAVSAIPRKTKIQTEKPVKSKWKGSENVQHLYLFYCFTIVLFSLGIQQALYFSLILDAIFCSDQNVMTLYITIVNLNCEPFKAESKNIYGLFYKIHFITYVLTKESCKHLIFPP